MWIRSLKFNTYLSEFEKLIICILETFLIIDLMAHKDRTEPGKSSFGWFLRQLYRLIEVIKRIT